MTATVYRLDDYRRDPADPLTVPCPYCEAEPGRRCVTRGQGGARYQRIHGPHPDRIATAGAVLTKENENA